MKTLIILISLIVIGFFMYLILKSREGEVGEFEKNKYNYFRGHLK